MRVLLTIQQVAVLVGILLFWEYVLADAVGDYWVSRPSRIAAELEQLVSSGVLARHVYATLRAAFLGYTVGVVAAVALAFIAATFPPTDRIAAPFMAAGYTFPKEAIAPLFIIFFGIGIGSKVAIAIAAVFFIVYPNALSGAQEVNKDLINALKVSGANSWNLFTMAVAPSAAPWIFTGMRLSIRYAFTGVIFGEMLSGNLGLGYLVKYSANMFNASGAFAALSVVMVVGVLLTLTLERIEAVASRWHR